jgi:hypothetical protein
MRRCRFGDASGFTDAADHMLAFERAKCLPTAVEQRLSCREIPERAPCEVEASAAERGLRKVVVVGMKHAVRVIHA